MSYKINFIVFKDHLKVELEGFAKRESFAQISADTNKIVEANHITKILVDGTAMKGTIGIFDSVEHIENYPVEMRFREYAIISPPENKSGNDFFQNAAYNRGYKISFFYDEASAKEWLKVEQNVEPEMVVEKEY